MKTIRRLWLDGSMSSWRGYAATIAICAVATLTCYLLQPFLAGPNLIMIYLLAVAIVASRYGARESTLACLLNVVAFDFFFVPPHLTLAVADSQYLLTFAMMLAVALLISGLSQRLRRQVAASLRREQRASALYAFSRELATSLSRGEIASAGARNVRAVFGCDVAVFFTSESGPIELVEPSASGFEDLQTVEAVLSSGQRIGSYLPISAARGVVGVLAAHSDQGIGPHQIGPLETFANGIAVAIERTILAKESQASRLSADTERMRNVLLNSLSHDLRTPLTVIAGAASTLAEGTGDSKGLASTIVDEAQRMNRHVQNLLDMTRLEAAVVKAHLDWHSIEEIVGAALADTETQLRGRSIKVCIPPALPLVRVDGVLVEKALVNLLQNVAVHTPESSPVEIRVSTPARAVRIQVADKGPGFRPGDESRIFEKFYQPNGSGDHGFGLGLAICRAVAEAHAGRTWAENRPGGGARFYLELAAVTPPPEVVID